MRWIWIVSIWTVALAQSPIERSVGLAREKKYAEARRELRGVAAPADPRAAIGFHRLKAAIASGLGDHGEAAREMNLALALSPGDANILLATAVAEQQAGKLDDALKHAAGARAVAPSAARETVIADIQEARGNYVEAAQSYQRAAELAPAVEQYRINLALELVRHATFEPAATVLERASADFPRSARVKTLLAVTYYAQAKVNEAVRALIAALDVEPTFAPAREYLARVTLDAQTPDAGAVAALCRAPDGFCAAAKLRADGDDSAAFADLKLLAFSQGGTLRCELARAYEWREQWAAARGEMEACVKWASQNPQHHYRLARIYQRLGLTELARREAELQRATTRQAAEEVERREQAVQSFQYVLK